MRSETSIRAEVMAELRLRFPQSTEGWPQTMPSDEMISAAIFSITGWELPFRKWRLDYIHRFWKQYIYQRRIVVQDVAAPSPDKEHLREIILFGRRKDFYETAEWRTLRYARLKLDKRICACCGGIGGNQRHVGNGPIVIHVDHIKPRSRFPELCLTLDNTQCLCEDCNLGKGAIDETNWRTIKEMP